MKKNPFSRQLFWEYDINTVDLKKHKRFIIERVITRGSKKDFEKLLQLYSKREIRFALRQAVELDPQTRNFCSQYFNIPEEEMYVADYYY